MKKILFTCIAGIAMIGSTNLNAQSYWAGTPATVQTSTTGNCGVGSNLAVGGTTSIGLVATDAKLHIKDPIYYDNTFGPYNIPETKIDRIIYGTTVGNLAVIPNIFEIWQTQYTSPSNPTPIAGPSLLYVVNAAGNVGIANATPTYKLDVTGDIRCSSNAIVGGDIYITHSNDALWRNVFANANSTGLALYSKSTTLDGPAILMTGTSASTYAGDIRFFDGASSSSRFAFGKPVGGSANGTMMEQVVIEGNGDISMPRDNDADWRSINAKAGHGALSINAATGSSTGGVIELFGSQGSGDGRVHFICNKDGEDATGVGFNFMTYNASETWNSKMRIYKNGKVVIGPDGINMPSDYDLYVDGGILTKKLKVALPSDGTNWSDYVFAKDYKLRSLAEVEKFINNNKHLPDVPSAKEVSDDGIDVAAMDAKLLRKIEELTLYVIDQQKQIEDLKKKQNK